MAHSDPFAEPHRSLQGEAAFHPVLNSSWLIQVDLWLGTIERDAIACGVFISIADPRRKLIRYIRHNNKARAR